MLKTSTGTKLSSHTKESLTLLIHRVQTGDQQSYRLLLHELRNRAIGVARAILASSGNKKSIDVEDVAQEVLMAIHRSLHTYRPENDFFAWFHAIVRFKIIDAFRKAKENLMLDNDTVEQIIEEASFDWSQLTRSDQENSDFKNDVLILLRSLPEKQRRVLELTKVEGRSVSEVAKILNLSEADVKVSTHRALKTLKSQMEKT